MNRFQPTVAFAGALQTYLHVAWLMDSFAGGRSCTMYHWTPGGIHWETIFQELPTTIQGLILQDLYLRFGNGSSCIA